jgi:hypothetical protein
MYSRAISVVALCIVVSACSSRPQQTLTKLNTSDPKFNSPECLDIRARALTYDDKVGERMAVGFVSGLLLGPFGLPIAAAADARQEEERKVFNREITLRCNTNGEAIVAAQDAEQNQIFLTSQQPLQSQQ